MLLCCTEIIMSGLTMAFACIKGSHQKTQVSRSRVYCYSQILQKSDFFLRKMLLSITTALHILYILQSMFAPLSMDFCFVESHFFFGVGAYFMIFVRCCATSVFEQTHFLFLPGILGSSATCKVPKKQPAICYKKKL